MQPTAEKRESGLALLGDLPWGSHFCQFYRTKKDLLDILLPYFRAGLEGNELCAWVVDGPPGPGEAMAALRENLPRYEEHAAMGRMEVIPAARWNSGSPSSVHNIVSRLDKASASGFAGFRLACSAFSEKKGGRTRTRHSAEAISRDRAIAVFTYPRDRFDAVGLMEVVRNHRFALVRNSGRWEIIESSEARIVKDALQRSEEKLHSLFTNMSEGFAYCRTVLDGDGKPCDCILLEINPAFETLTGLKAKDIIGKRGREIIPGLEKDPADWLGRFGRVALTGEPEQFESYMERLGRWYSVAAFCPHPGYFAATFSDTTERKQNEEAIIRAHQELLNHASRLEEMNKELESFSYSVSHDLRAPLRAIAGFTRMILDEQAAGFDSETRRRFGIIQQNAEKMGQLIDGLLRLSRLGRAGMKRSRLDMNGLAREVLQEIRQGEPGRELAVEIHDLPAAWGDPAMIRQVLANLLSNAAKFTRGAPGARIEVGSFREPGEQVYYVKDNGCGFDMKYYNKLFGVFQRLVGESQFEGTGVGLAIVQRIVQRHGGRVWAVGKTGEGATFYFTLSPGEQG